MIFWKSVLCYAHLIQNTFWEFHQRHDFNLTVTTVNENWQNSTTSLSNHYKSFFDFDNIMDFELVARNAEYEALSYCQNKPFNEMKGKGRVGYFDILNEGKDNQNTHSWLISLNHQQKSLTISLRGTMGRKEILNDLDFRSTSLPCYMFPKSCQSTQIKVHHGFLMHFINIGEQITNLIKIYQNLHPSYATVLTCHSLGAATGVLLIRHWIETNAINFHAAYLFGLPIVGNEDFANSFNSDKVVKIISENDLVPTLGYVHGKHIEGRSIWAYNKKLYTTLDHYNRLNCQQLSWKEHSIFFGIQINDNYCKLQLGFTIEKVEQTNNEEGDALKMFCAIVLFIVLCISVVVSVYHWLKKFKS